MSIDVVVNIVLCILSFLLAAISVIAVCLTLRQNRRMIESSTRPYMAVYLDNRRNLATLVVKNYGASSATITEFDASVDFSKLTSGTGISPIKSLIGYTFPPGHALTTVFEYDAVKKHFSEFDVRISYTSSTATYSESIHINITALQELFSAQPQIPKGKELLQIARELNSIDDKLMQIK